MDNLILFEDFSEGKMKASEYVKLLQDLIDKEGDLTITSSRADGSIQFKLNPRVQYLKVLNPREHKQTYATLDQHEKGEKVIAI